MLIFLENAELIIRDPGRCLESSSIMLTCQCNYPLLYIKTGVYIIDRYFFRFALKHRILIWVLVRCASTSTDSLCFDQI